MGVFQMKRRGSEAMRSRAWIRLATLRSSFRTIGFGNLEIQPMPHRIPENLPPAVLAIENERIQGVGMYKKPIDATVEYRDPLPEEACVAVIAS
jgi:hypothetical protein